RVTADDYRRLLAGAPGSQQVLGLGSGGRTPQRLALQFDQDRLGASAMHDAGTDRRGRHAAREGDALNLRRTAVAAIESRLNLLPLEQPGNPGIGKKARLEDDIAGEA